MCGREKVWVCHSQIILLRGILTCSLQRGGGIGKGAGRSAYSLHSGRTQTDSQSGEYISSSLTRNRFSFCSQFRCNQPGRPRLASAPGIAQVHPSARGRKQRQRRKPIGYLRGLQRGEVRMRALSHLSCATPRKHAFLSCGYLDFESAVAARNDEFKGSFHSSYIDICRTSKLSQATQYLASMLSDTFIKCICRNISCALGKMELALEVKFHLDFY